MILVNFMLSTRETTELLIFMMVIHVFITERFKCKRQVSL